jgi:tripartite-type tricarboxylate transporter receptor subunit TctC
MAALDRNGLEPMGGSPEELAQFQARELVLWREVVRRANITAEG